MKRGESYLVSPFGADLPPCKTGAGEFQSFLSFLTFLILFWWFWGVLVCVFGGLFVLFAFHDFEVNLEVMQS